ncbi:MAG: hypothetical protein ACI97A_002579 [Planctomycetota bacterium]|jgi:hypothetical protein
MRICFAILFVLAVTQGDAFPQSNTLELRVFDVEGFTRSNDDAPIDHWQLPIRTAYRTKDEELGGLEPVGDDVSRADFLVRMIRDAVGPESWDQSGTFMRLNESGTRLIIRQSPEILGKVDRFLKSIAIARRQSYQVEILVIKATAGSLASLGVSRYQVGSKKFEVLRSGKNQGLEILNNVSGQAIDGQRIRIRSQTIAHVVGAQSAQIAQSATRTEPEVVKIPEGIDLYVRPSTLPNGLVNIRVQGTISGAFKTEDFVSESAGVATIQLPSMRVRKFTSSGTVSLGDGMVVGCVSSTDGSPRFVIVRVVGKQSVRKSFAGVRGQTRVYDAGFLISPYLGTPAIELGWSTMGPRMFENWNREDPIFRSDRKYLLPETAYDLIRQSVTPRFWENNLYSLEFLGNQLWVTAGPEQHKGIGALLDDLAKSRGRSLVVASFCLLAKRSLVESLRAEGEGDWIRQLLRHKNTLRLHTVVGAGETGSRLEWLDGAERAYVGGAAVDVAQGAEIAAPIVETGFSGFYLRVAPCIEGDAFGLDFRFDINLPQGPKAKSNDYLSGDYKFSLPISDWRQSSGHVRCKPDRYTLLSEFGVGDDEVALIVTRLQHNKE